MNNLSKLLTALLTVTLFVGLMFSDQLRSEKTGYAPTTLITGANRGIGLEFTKQYLQKGWKVIATCRNPDRADELNNLKKNYPDHLSIMQLDVIDHNRIDELALQLSDTPIDVLLNNAGISGGSSNQIFGTMDYTVYEDVLAVNTIGPMKMAEAFYPHVKGSQLKKIITGSIETAFKRGGGRLFFYRSSKTALNMLMVNLALQLKSRGIAVGMVNPGATDTDFMTGLPFPMRPPEVAVANIENITAENTAAYINYNGKPVPW